MSDNSDDVAGRIMELFAGYSRASGTHGMPEQDGPKWSIKATAQTIAEGPTKAMWEKHLAGKRPLGVVPILDDSSCVWGSIDIDKYDMDLLEVVARVETLKLPLVPCVSKSGGLHLFLFCDSPVSASLMQLTLKSLAATVGYADSEIFPKQTSIRSGDSGNWMVMPYYGDTFGGKLKLQHGLKKTGARQTLSEFVTFAENRRITPEQLAECAVSPETGDSVTSKKGKRSTAAALPPVLNDVSVPFGDGPPCLEKLAPQGISDRRNITLFNMAIYCKRAYPDDWKQRLGTFNALHIRLPLPSEEVTAIVRQLEKKEYFYQCGEEPLRGSCNSRLCKARRYGVGNGSLYPRILSVRKKMMEKPIYYVRLEGDNRELELDSKQYYYYDYFVQACIDQLNMDFRPLDRNVWSAIRGEATAHISTETPGEDETEFGQRKELMRTFLKNRRKGQRREDILRGAPFLDEDDGHHYFQLKDADKFFKREREPIKRSQLTALIAILNGVEPRVHGSKKRKPIPGVTEAIETSIKNESVRLWKVPDSALSKFAELDPPDMPPEKL
jgi:hypothetical protein